MWAAVMSWGPGAMAKDVVQAIDVKGNQRIEKMTVLKSLGIPIGKPLADDALNKGLKRLYATGYFTDVVLGFSGGTVEVILSENPTINAVVFEGNHEVTDKILKTQMKMRPRMLFDKTGLQYEVQRLAAIYRAKGYFGARITPKIIQQVNNRVDVVFEIQEGDPATIAAIHFKGNEAFSGWDLESVISTKQSSWWKFWASDDIYDPDNLEMDQEALRKFYLNQGYADFKLLSAQVELLPNYGSFVITFHLEEGERYKFGTLSLENNLPHLKSKNLEADTIVSSGDWYSVGLVERTVQSLTDQVNKEGVAFVDVTPVPDIDEKQKVVNLKFVVQPGPKIFVNRINIFGNGRTIDPVLRREFAFAEGDAFNASRLRTSDRNLNNLGFFKKIDMKESPVPGRPDLMDVNVTVQEQGTGDISFQVGYATVDGILGMIRLTERNLFGRGYRFTAGVEASQIRKRLSADFVNPAFLDRNLAVGVGAFYETLNSGKYSSYKSTTVGGKTWMGYNLSTHLIQRWKYRLAQEKIKQSSGLVFPLVSQDQGKFISSSVGHELSYDRRNNPLMPTAGYVLSVDTEYVGVGGNNRFLRNILSAAYYIPLTTKVFIGMDFQYGRINEMGRRVRIADKFFLGGDNLRGFEYSGAGPRGSGASPGNQNKWDDSLGGDNSVTASAQLNFPLGMPEDFAISGYVFCDVGTLWDTKLKERVAAYNADPANAANQIQATNDKKLRSSVGVGIKWASPMGVIGFSFGKAISKASGDATQVFMLNLGTGRF